MFFFYVYFGRMLHQTKTDSDFFLKEYYDYRFQASVHLKVTFYAKFCVHTYTQKPTNINTLILVMNTWTWHMNINWAVIFFSSTMIEQA